jgi:hypothetical protein
MAQGYTQEYTRSGYSGFSGVSGTGTSGYSGFSGQSGYSGYSGYSGISGYSGYSGFSAVSGYSGFSATGTQASGFSGYTGVSGYSGYSGVSGYSGYTGVAGASDIRLKRDIRPYTLGLEVIERIDPVSFKWNSLFGSSDESQIGIIGQELAAVLPIAISTQDFRPQLNEIIEFEKAPIIFALVNSVKELRDRLKDVSRIR